MKIRLLALLLIGLTAPAVWAGPITVDGDLKDWIKPPEGKATDWSRLKRPATTLFQVEDQAGGDNAYLNPGWGGQAYDAEAMYLEIIGHMLYIAIVTGLKPDNPQWKPGDIALDFGDDGRYEYGIVTVGDAQRGADPWNAGIGMAGEVYRVSAWNLGLWEAPGQLKQGSLPSPYQEAHPTSIQAGQKIGNASLVYKAVRYEGRTSFDLGNLGGKHYLIEAAVDLDLFDEFRQSTSAKGFTVHWTMGCANDWIALDPPLPIAEVPAPGSLSLVGMGLLGLLRGGHHRRVMRRTS